MKSISILFVTVLFLVSCSNNESNQNIEQQTITEISQVVKIKKGNIQSFNGKFLCTETDRSIVANRDAAKEWELFIFNWNEKNDLSITSYDDYLLSADLEKNGEITATRKEKREWETFTIVPLENNHIAIKAFNGKYLTVDITTFKVNASADKIGDYERFKIIEILPDLK